MNCSEEALIRFYSANTQLPGPLNRYGEPRNTGPNEPKTGPAMLRELHLQTQFLDYADESLRELRGAPVLPGHNIQQFDAKTLPDNLFTGTMVERCGCDMKRSWR